MIGSGPIVIGQAAEFDYAGTQACKALREEGVTTVLVNSNPATIMTDEDIADVVYIEPLTVEVVERIIAREKPDGLLPTLGGQTGLNLAVDLADAGVLDAHNVRLLGTPLDSIRKAEDRDLFRKLLLDIGEPVPPSQTVGSMEEALAAFEELGLPLVVRPAYTLGGTGGGIANTVDEFERIVGSGLAASPIDQVLLEKSLVGWKEIEYEVMRDGADNCITVCNMENIDPMGVHTGDSIGRRAQPNALRQGVSNAPVGRAEDHPGAWYRGRVQYSIRTGTGGCRRGDIAGGRQATESVLRYRSEPACKSQFGARQQGDRLSDCPRGREDRGPASGSTRYPTRSPRRRWPRLNRPWTTAWSRFHAGRSTSSPAATGRSQPR